MKEVVFSVFDSKAELFSRPMMAVTTDAGKRLFHQAVNAEGAQYGKYPGDYTLFEIGVWDDNKGVITMRDFAENLGLAAIYLGTKEVTAEIDDVVRSMTGNAIGGVVG